jgi:hypothetical protein
MITITLLSTAMALSLSVVVWRMVHDDRRRREARVHALTDLAARPDLRAASSSSAALTLRAPEPPSAWGTRTAIMAGLALAATAIVLTMLTARTRASLDVLTSSAAVQSDAPATAPLELLSLRDTREAGTLTIAGLVQNPRHGAVLRGVQVTADVFDAAGTRVGSSTSRVDVVSLAPGDQTPFVLNVAADNAARYRVSFRASDGRVIQHVDRRRQAANAGAW